MPRPPDLRRRQELIDALVDAFAGGGIGDRSLRDVASAVGTSHRMLLHHFGSREELLLTIVEQVERRQMTRLDELPDDPADALAAAWADLRRPELRPFERLFFECYARGANGEPPFDRLVPAAVDDWLRPATTAGPVPDADPALTRLALAVVRGLLLDLVATGATDETTAALHRFAALVEAVPGTIAATPGRQVP
jgi:AcrR family transcriptional regulator